MEVLGHTSLSSTSVRSRTLLWRQMVYPPLWQQRAWPTDIDSPQAQWVGRLLICQPYLKHKASLKSPLCRRKSNSSRGMAEIQLDAPFSFAHSKSLCWLLESSSRIDVSFSSSYAFLSFFTSALSWVLSVEERGA